MTQTVRVTDEYFRIRTNPGSGLPHQKLIGRWDTHYPAILEAYRHAAEGKVVIVERVTIHEAYETIVGLMETETVTGEVLIGENYRYDTRLSREGAGRQWSRPETIEVEG